jgi:hypothetical protein
VAAAAACSFRSVPDAALPLQRQHGDYFSHSKCPRAQIFRRDLGSVHDVQDLQQLMRANNFHSDPLAHNNAEFQIAARFDLLDPATTNETASCGGAFDAKVDCHRRRLFPPSCGLTLPQVTSLSLHGSRSAFVVSGPTHQAVPTFACAPSPLNLNLNLNRT